MFRVQKTWHRLLQDDASPVSSLCVLSGFDILGEMACKDRKIVFSSHSFAFVKHVLGGYFFMEKKNFSPKKRKQRNTVSKEFM